MMAAIKVVDPCKWMEPIYRLVILAFYILETRQATNTSISISILSLLHSLLSKLCPHLIPVRRSSFRLLCCIKREVVVLSLGMKSQSESTTGAYLVRRKEDSSTWLIFPTVYLFRFSVVILFQFFPFVFLLWIVLRPASIHLL